MYSNALLFLLFGIFSAFIIVPSNAYIQHLAPSVHLGTIIAGNNFIQNIFMFTFLAVTTVFAYYGFNSKILFFMMGFAGVYLVYMMSKTHLLMAGWAVFIFVFSLRYKFEYKGLDNLPTNQGILLLGNHVSFIDWLILQVPLKKRISFMMDKGIYNYKIFKPVLKKAYVIPISSKSFKDSMKEASKRLQNSNIVALYPEGGISKDNELKEFKNGYSLLEGGDNYVVVAFFIDGMFGSVFAKNKQNQHNSYFKRRTIRVEFLKPIPKNTKADELQKIIQKVKDKS